MARRAILFDVGGPLDLEFAWEIAVDGAIAAACGMEGIAVDQAMLDAASERAVDAFAPDAYASADQAAIRIEKRLRRYKRRRKDRPGPR